MTGMTALAPMIRVPVSHSGCLFFDGGSVALRPVQICLSHRLKISAQFGFSANYQEGQIIIIEKRPFFSRKRSSDYPGRLYDCEPFLPFPPTSLRFCRDTDIDP